MIQITEYLTTKVSKSKIKATDKTLAKIIKSEFDKYGHDCDLNHVDVSNVTSMSALFACDEEGEGKNPLGLYYLDLNPDISKWDVSNVTDMWFMFYECSCFNCDISEWNVSNVLDADCMFYGCTQFDQNLSGWYFENIYDKGDMFVNCGIQKSHMPTFNKPSYFQ